jgi:hypothetical protein
VILNAVGGVARGFAQKFFGPLQYIALLSHRFVAGREAALEQFREIANDLGAVESSDEGLNRRSR